MIVVKNIVVAYFLDSSNFGSSVVDFDDTPITDSIGLEKMSIVAVAAETFQMEMKNTEPMRKRTKFVEEKEPTAEDGALVEVAEEETEANPPVSEQMEAHMSQILEKIDGFTQQVSEFLESGKSFFKDLSNEFEERVIAIHKEQMEKWQEEIKELRYIDASNEEINAVLQNAQQIYASEAVIDQQERIAST
ncbi:hypothetical protein Tco_0073202 [Tanacetum coccineum]